ncbi:dihydrofolate reductase family protein [Frigidibacter oleivorans]|uniref:dihydrofolate reductase family protein n=1 Tax=Frigidibacter oleivorans TaxID=2487129 RepID=UPI0013DEE502|nr:dihydrofolate reductase family protein [Frigidibacter oleivorans]
MGRLIARNWISVDGFIAGNGGDLTWIRGDEEMGAYELDLIGGADAVLFGGKTYREFSSFWPNVPQMPQASAFEQAFAEKINGTRKIAVSRTLEASDWAGTEIVSAVTADSIGGIKASAERTVMYGSADVLGQIISLGLLDELHLLVHPLLLGGGLNVFDSLGKTVELTRVRAAAFGSGVVLVQYAVSI